MGKRTNTAVWVESANRWQINVQKDGKRKTFTCAKPGRTGQREANAKADAWIEDGVHSVGKKITELYAEYIESLKIRTSKANWSKVESFGKTHFIPALGSRKLSTVTENDLQCIIDKAYNKGRSRKTLKNYLGFINGFYKYCRMERITTMRPEFVSVPSGARYKGHTIIQPDGIATLFKSDQTTIRGKQVRDDLINAYRFAVLTGLRPGEIRGLKWSDIIGAECHVNRAINQLNEITKGKNENAIRVFILPVLAQAVIAEQRNDTFSSEFVFPVGSMQNYNRRWSAYCQTNGIPHTSLYEMRHTFVSIIKSLPEGQVKELVGHSANMDTFGIYGHTVSGEMQAIAAEVDAQFKPLIK